MDTYAREAAQRQRDLSIERLLSAGMRERSIEIYGRRATESAETARTEYARKITEGKPLTDQFVKWLDVRLDS